MPKRVSFQNKQKLRKYLLNPRSVSDYEVKQLRDSGCILEDGSLPENVRKSLSKNSRIYWKQGYEAVLYSPNEISTKSDYQRRERLVENGFLIKLESGEYSRTIKLTPKEKSELHGKGRSIITLLKETTSKEDLIELLEKRKKYLNSMSKTIKVLKETCAKYGIDYNEYIIT